MTKKQVKTFKTNYPEQLFVKRETDGDTAYFLTYEDPEELEDVEEVVAVYKFDALVTVKKHCSIVIEDVD